MNKIRCYFLIHSSMTSIPTCVYQTPGMCKRRLSSKVLSVHLCDHVSISLNTVAIVFMCSDCFSRYHGCSFHAFDIQQLDIILHHIWICPRCQSTTCGICYMTVFNDLCLWCQHEEIHYARHAILKEWFPSALGELVLEYTLQKVGKDVERIRQTHVLNWLNMSPEVCVAK